MDKQKLAYIYAILAIIFWSTVATAFKISLENFDYIQLLFYSTVVAVLILFVIIIVQKKLSLLFSGTKKQYLYSALLGLLNPFIYYLMLFKAYSILPAQLAQPLNYTWPIMIVILSIPLLKQKLSAKGLIAIIISFTGVIFISMKGSFFNFKDANVLGILLAVGTSVIWALFFIFNLKDKRDELVKIFLSFLFGLIFLLPVILLRSDIRINFDYKFLSIIYVGIFEMGITFVLWLKAMKLTKSNDKISNLVFISPFLSLIFIHYFLHEDIYNTTIIGLVLIVAGIVIQKVKLKKM